MNIFRVDPEVKAARDIISQWRAAHKGNASQSAFNDLLPDGLKLTRGEWQGSIYWRRGSGLQSDKARLLLPTLETLLPNGHQIISAAQTQQLATQPNPQTGEPTYQTVIPPGPSRLDTARKMVPLALGFAALVTGVQAVMHFLSPLWPAGLGMAAVASLALRPKPLPLLRTLIIGAKDIGEALMWESAAPLEIRWRMARWRIESLPWRWAWREIAVLERREDDRLYRYDPFGADVQLQQTPGQLHMLLELPAFTALLTAPFWVRQLIKYGLLVLFILVLAGLAVFVTVMMMNPESGGA